MFVLFTVAATSFAAMMPTDAAYTNSLGMKFVRIEAVIADSEAGCF
jgi:hypothetical protein